jgi:hypothetical protein
MSTINSQCKVAVVDAKLMPWLLQSKHCPTMENLWLQNEEHVLSLPEYVFDDVHPEYHVTAVLSLPPHIAQFAAQIRYFVTQYFGKARYGRMLRFKDFSHLPKKNLRRFIPIKVAPSKTVNICVLDATLLNAQLVHKAYKAKEPDFTCEGNCGCVTNIIIEDILNCLGSTERQNLDAKFRRKFLSTLPSNLARPPSSDEIDSSSSTNSTPAQTRGGGEITQAPAATTNTAATTRASRTNASAAAAKTMNQTVEVEVEDRAAERGALRDLVESAESAALECCGLCAPVGGSDLDSFVSPAETAAEKLSAVRCVLRSELYYKRLDAVTTSGFTIFVEKSEAARMVLTLQEEQHRALLGLDYVIRFLSTLFQYPRTKLHVVVEDSATMAFNRGGELFF